MKIKIIDAVVKNSGRLRTNEQYIRESLRPDTEIDFAHMSKGFPSVECDLHAAFNSLRQRFRRNGMGLTAYSSIVLMTPAYMNAASCFPSPYSAAMFRQW